MKKGIYLLLIFCTFFICMGLTFAKEATMYFFHGEGCPHCAEEEVLLQELEKKYEDLTIIRYEVWYNAKNQQLMQDMSKDLNINITGVPLTIIGDKYVKGYISSYSSKIEDLVIDAISEESELPTEGINDKEDEEEKESDKNLTIYDLPLLGKVDVKKISIPLIAIAIGLVDGFNPCAMWILLFLISMLIGMNNKKRMWILGLTFLITSALVYMLIMMSWIEIVVNIGASILFRNIIAVISLIGAIININSYIKTKKTDGCVVVDDKKRKKIFDKIKKFTHEKSFWLALIGIITLAVSVNVIELACSAGLPLVFSQILTLNNIKGVAALIYTLIYILFFLLDDLVIFIIAMVTLKVSGISTKYTKLSHLIGGILMFIIGILLIFKPEWLMFNFS